MITLRKEKEGLRLKAKSQSSGTSAHRKPENHTICLSCFQKTEISLTATVKKQKGLQKHNVITSFLPELMSQLVFMLIGRCVFNSSLGIVAEEQGEDPSEQCLNCARLVSGRTRSGSICAPL